jgi:hypothetical protein
MKKILSLLVAVMSLLAVPLPVLAATPAPQSVQRVPAWDLTGNYTITFDCPTCVPHYIQITAYNPYTGVFSGTGFLQSNPTFTWNVSGTLTGTLVTMRIVYTGVNAGYFVTLTGTLAADGTMSGTAVDSSGNQFPWSTTSGTATYYATHGQFVGSQTNKQTAALSNLGMPVQP